MRRLGFYALLLCALLLGKAHAADTIKIATVGPMTGQNASIGAQMAKGADLAVRNINEAGGLLGKKLELLTLDDACDPRQATAVANQLANQGVVFVAGHFCSSATIPASNIYSEQGMTMITPASTNPLLTERKLPYVFRMCGRDDQQGVIAADFIAARFKDRRLAVLHDKSSYGKGLADVTKASLNAKGIKEVVYDSVTVGERDFAPLISRLKKEGVGVVFFGGYQMEAGLIKRQAAEQGLDLVLVAGDSLITSEYWTITGDAGENTFMTFAPDPRRNPGAAKIVESFRAAKYEPEGYTLFNYAVVEAFVAAAKKAGTVDADAVQKVLKSEAVDTLLGAVRFDAKGDNANPGFIVYRWTKGDYTPVE
jgi:branched-chain amino acid transport system substrate-binding protein